MPTNFRPVARCDRYDQPTSRSARRVSFCVRRAARIDIASMDRSEGRMSAVQMCYGPVDRPVRTEFTAIITVYSDPVAA